MPNSHTLKQHRAELQETLEEIYREIRIPLRPLKHFPPLLATHLWYKLHPNRQVPAVAHFSDKPNQAIRKLHNFYGWRAEHQRRGRCAGALYRTARFMEWSVDKRNGSKNEGRNIHIEHTVPAKVLETALKYRIKNFTTPSDLHDFLVRHSVSCAFHGKEEGAMRKYKVLQRTNLAFDCDGRRVGRHPFQRYKPLLDPDPDFKIYNVVTGKQIDIETFTFEDHFETLQAACDLIASARNRRAMVYSAAFFDPVAWAYFAA